jgi:hypothetical protein
MDMMATTSSMGAQGTTISMAGMKTIFSRVVPAQIVSPAEMVTTRSTEGTTMTSSWAMTAPMSCVAVTATTSWRGSTVQTS